MNYKESKKIIEAVHKWYPSEIKRVSLKNGGMYKLSAMLGFDGKYLWKAIAINSFTALRQIIEKIYGDDGVKK